LEYVNNFGMIKVKFTWKNAVVRFVQRNYVNVTLPKNLHDVLSRRYIINIWKVCTQYSAVNHPQNSSHNPKSKHLTFARNENDGKADHYNDALGPQRSQM